MHNRMVVRTSCFKDVARDVMELDALAYQSSSIYVGKQWYMKRYHLNSWVYQIRDDDEKLIAYALVTGIVPKMFDVICEGLLDGDYSISPSAFRLVPSSQYYLASLAVHPAYRRQGYAKVLMENVMKDIGADEIVALANDSTAKLLKGFGFEIKHFVQNKYEVAVKWVTHTSVNFVKEFEKREKEVLRRNGVKA